MTIRKKWFKLYRENKPDGKTLSRCIRDTVATADHMWTQDLSKK